MKKIVIASLLGAVTLAVPGTAFAEEGKLPGRRPPCSIIRKSPLEASVGQAACEHPASNPAASGQ